MIWVTLVSDFTSRFILNLYFVVESDPICVSCNKPCGHHSCKSCKKPCHAITLCSQSCEEEGYGAQVICNSCSDTNSTKKGAKAGKIIEESGTQLLYIQLILRWLNTVFKKMENSRFRCVFLDNHYLLINKKYLAYVSRWRILKVI